MEYSFESIMAIGTGMIASCENTEAQKNGPIEYDGYLDGLNLDIARTSEQLHFMDTYDKLQSLHSAEKLKMIKKINTAYNGKTISNANVANSVESFCNNAMSTEGVLTNIKEKLVEIFKRFCEFIKKCIMKFKMNLSKYYRLFTMKIIDGGDLFFGKSEKFIDKLYELNSKLIIKISHASQITSEQKDVYLLIKSISDKMIQNCFSLFSIGVNNAKLILKKTTRPMVIDSYNPKGLHKKLHDLVQTYDNNIDLFDEYIVKTMAETDIPKSRVDLQNIDSKIDDDRLLLRDAAKTFKKITFIAYDEDQKIREQIEKEKDAKRKEELEKEYKEFSKQMDEVVKSYVSDFEERINASFDEVRSASDDRKKAMDELRDLDNHADHAEQVFNKIKNKFK